MKYRLSPRRIPRAEPEGFPEGSGDISLYTPPLVTIQLQYTFILLSLEYMRKQMCHILSLKYGYNKMVPPMPPEYQCVVPVPVKVSILLYKIVGIDEGSQSIELQFKIHLQWKDHRITYQNLKITGKVRN